MPGAAQNNTLGMMGMANCTGLTVMNAFTYYQTPPFTQATLVDISADQLTWTIQARAPRQPASSEVLLLFMPIRCFGPIRRERIVLECGGRIA